MGKIKDRPILFSAPMIRALHAGTKTQTRRIVKPQPELTDHSGFRWKGSIYGKGASDRETNRNFAHTRASPYGMPGDLLVIRETWQYADWTQDGAPYIRYRADGAERLIEDIPEHWSDRLQDSWAALSVPANYNIDSRASDRRWRPASHMPRWASRLTLRITDVRVQRLQDITEQDAVAEGIPGPFDVGYPAFHLPGDSKPRYSTATAAFNALWTQINGDYSWSSNPWVWAITFEVIHQNVDAYLESLKVAV